MESQKPNEDPAIQNLQLSDRKESDGQGDTKAAGIEYKQEGEDDYSKPIQGQNLYAIEDVSEEELKNNPYILSETLAVGPNSFVSQKQEYRRMAPPPKYFEDSILQDPLPKDKATILKSFKEQKNGNLVCTDKEILDKQKGVLVDVLKQLTVTLMKGLTIAHISLPVKIFEPRSSLQRIVDFWGFAPSFLNEAAKISDPLERFKKVIAFGMGGIYICCNQEKPFNPILGETLQSEYEDGTKIYCEHTSHHPPISNFLMQPPDNSYEFWGHYEYTGQMAANSLKQSLKGPNYIKFADGQLIRFKSPSWKLGGTVMGERTIEATGSVFFQDCTNNYKAVIIFSTYQKTGFWKKTESGRKDEIQGILYQCHPTSNVQYTSKILFSKTAEDVKDLKNVKDVVKKIGDISGSWLKELIIDGKKYWDINEDVPQRQKYCMQDVLPSDWRFREDLIWLKYKYPKIAHQWKVRMEEQQRYDKKLRQKVIDEKKKAAEAEAKAKEDAEKQAQATEKTQ